MVNVFNNKNGMVMIVVALSMVVLFGFAAISIDVGWMIHHKSELQNSADAAALAGVAELPDKTGAKAVAEDYMLDNELGDDRSSITVTRSGDRTEVNSGGDGSFYFDTTFQGQNMIIVTAYKPIDYFFAKIFGNSGGTVSVKSAAVIAPLRSVFGGLRPFGVVKDTWVPNEQVVLKTGSPNGESGNYYALALDGTGGNIYKNTIINGSENTFAIGDYVYTETGDMVGPTKQGVENLMDQCNHRPECTSTSYVEGCPRLILVPLVNTMDVNGRKEIMIVGFAQFFLEDYKNAGGHTEITGRFIKEVAPGEADQDIEDNGAMGVKLVFVE